MRRPMLVLAVLLPISGCGQPQPAENATQSAAPAVEATQAGVQREEIAAPTPSPSPITQPAIQTQPGPDGSQVALNKVAVTGDILTVQLTYTGGNGTQFVDVGQISLIDDATSRQIGVLKDNAGKYLAAPLTTEGGKLVFSLGDAPVIVWMKYPAPPASSKTVSINVPDVVPFDGVPVTR